MSLFENDKSAERLPVSLITGFLGSGKTTLLNRLLRHDAMSDSAVIINEYGEVSLDHLLVERVDGEVAVLASGCICCTIRSDLEETLRTCWSSRDRGEVPPFRRILVETTGLADPAPIVQLLLNNPLVSHFLRLDTVVTTVDAANAIHQLDHQYEAVKQVALADRLLITKCDLVSNIAALEARLGRLNPGARIERVMHGEIDPAGLFGAGLVDPEKKAVDVRAGSTSRHSPDPASRRTSTTVTPIMPRPSQPRCIDHQLRARVRRTARLDGGLALARLSAQRARRGPAAGQRHSQSPRGADAGRDPRRPPCLPSAGGAPRMARRRPPLAHRVHYPRHRARRGARAMAGRPRGSLRRLQQSVAMRPMQLN